MSGMILPSELQGRSLEEPWALYRQVERQLNASSVGSVERRNALASLENIRRAINTRAAAPSAPRPGR